MGELAAMSKGEMDVARVLWKIGPASVRAVHETLSQEIDIDFATVQTYLRRLKSKGYATSKRVGRQHIYSARAKPKRVIRDTVEELVQRLFGGDAMPLVRHLVADRGINAEQLDELKALIEQLEDKESKK